MNSRQKGARGERAWRDVLKRAGFDKARRGQQFSGSPDSPDVVCPGMEDFHAEVKWVHQFAGYSWMEQSSHDAKTGQTPYVAWKRNGKPWLVFLRAEDFLALVHAAKRGASSL